MSERTLKRILGAVAALVALYVGVALLRGGLGGSPEEEGGAVRRLVTGLDPADVQEVRFTGGDETVRLSRSDGGWRVNDHPADSARVVRFWDGLSDARVTGPVARNPENHPRLGVTADSALRIVFRTSGEDERALLVGDPGPTPPGAYVRIPDRDAVHVLHTDVRGAAERGVDAWRDRTVVRVDTSRVRALELTREDGTHLLRREGGSWTLDGSAADSASVVGILGALDRLRATGFAPDTASMGPTDRLLVATGEAGDTLAALALSALEDAGYRVRARGDSTLYELTSFQAGRLFPDPDALGAGSGGDG